MIGASGWDTAVAVGTVAAAIATTAAVIVALFVSNRESRNTRATLAISQRTLELVEEDRRASKDATLVLDWVSEERTGLGPTHKAVSETRLRLRNLGPSSATDVQVRCDQSLGAGHEPPSSIVVDFLAPSQSVNPTGVMPPRTFGNASYPDAADLTWTDGNGTHTVTRQIRASFL